MIFSGLSFPHDEVGDVVASVVAPATKHQHSEHLNCIDKADERNKEKLKA